MTTLTGRRGAAHAEYVAGLLAPEEIRRGALSSIVIGDTPGFLRELARRRVAGLEAVWLAWAGEIEMLAAHGVTGRTARDAAKIALVVNDATAADFRRPEAFREVPAVRSRVRAVADEMDRLAAEGFDPAVYAKEIDAALGGAR